jgi:hypothetical protein
MCHLLAEQTAESDARVGGAVDGTLTSVRCAWCGDGREAPDVRTRSELSTIVAASGPRNSAGGGRVEIGISSPRQVFGAASWLRRPGLASGLSGSVVCVVVCRMLKRLGENAARCTPGGGNHGRRRDAERFRCRRCRVVIEL